MTKKRGPFKYGFWFGGGFMLGAYIVMWLMDGIGMMAIMLFGIIMRGLGFDPGTMG
jgi:hypothetical protein